MSVASGIVSQYRAALKTLEACVTSCPPDLWRDTGVVYPFWQIAYHAAFYTHLYLSESAESFKPWANHREKINSLDWYRDRRAAGDAPKPYSRDDVAGYIRQVSESVASRIAATGMDGPSGFHWLPMDKFELQLYNIRHAQHHAAQLVDRLRNEAAIEVDWVGMVAE